MENNSTIKLIAGLGNPGPDFTYTRHNIGFLTIDALANELGCPYWKLESGCMIASVKLASRELLLAKPQDFMNTSGGPLAKLMKSRGLVPDELLVIHDELDLADGELSLRFGGGLNAHNGLRSIKNKLQTADFWRLRVGIGRPPGRMEVSDFVLKELRGDAREELLVTANCAANLVIKELGV